MSEMVQALEVVVELEDIAKAKNIQLEAMKIMVSAMKSYTPKRIYAFSHDLDIDECRPIERVDYGLCKVAEALGKKNKRLYR